MVNKAGKIPQLKQELLRSKFWRNSNTSHSNCLLSSFPSFTFLCSEDRCMWDWENQRWSREKIEGVFCGLLKEMRGGFERESREVVLGEKVESSFFFLLWLVCWEKTESREWLGRTGGGRVIFVVFSSCQGESREMYFLRDEEGVCALVLPKWPNEKKGAWDKNDGLFPKKMHGDFECKNGSIVYLVKEK